MTYFINIIQFQKRNTRIRPMEAKALLFVIRIVVGFYANEQMTAINSQHCSNRVS